MTELRFGESTAVESGRISRWQTVAVERLMLDRRHRFRRAGAAAAVGGDPRRHARELRRQDRPDNKQNALRPAGPYATKILDLTRPFFWIAVVIGLGVVGAHDLRRAALPREAGRGARAEADARQHRARGQLDDHPRADPRGDGRADGRRRSSTSRRSRPAPTSCTSRSRRGSGGGSSRTTTRQRRRDRERAAHPGRHAGVAHARRARRRARPTGCYDNGVIHSFWIPELNGKKDVVPGPHAVPQARGRQARHVPRAVRRVLRSLARRHADARDRADRGRLQGVGAEPARSRRPKAALAAGRQQREVGLRELPQLRARRSRARSRRTSRTSPTAARSRATSTTELRQPLEVDLQRAQP